MSDMMGTQELARLLLKDTKSAESPSLMQGVIDSVENGSVTLYLSGSSAFPISGIKHFAHYSPSPGDVVWILKNGPDLMVVGRLSDSSSDTEIPPGTLSYTILTAEPRGWLFMNGQVIANASIVIPRLWTAGVPATWKNVPNNTLTLPDWRGRTLLGAGTGSGLTNRPLDSTGGAETHVLSIAEMPVHNHNFAYNNSPSAFGANYIAGSSSAGALGNAPTVVGNNGGGGAHNNMQPWAAANIMIKK